MAILPLSILSRFSKIQNLSLLDKLKELNCQQNFYSIFHQSWLRHYVPCETQSSTSVTKQDKIRLNPETGPALKQVVTFLVRVTNTVTTVAQNVLSWTSRKLGGPHAIRQLHPPSMIHCQRCIIVRCHAKRATDAASAHLCCDQRLVGTLLDDTPAALTSGLFGGHRSGETKFELNVGVSCSRCLRGAGSVCGSAVLLEDEQEAHHQVGLGETRAT